MSNEQSDYEYYTRGSSNNTLKYILLTVLIIGVIAVIIGLWNKNRILNDANQRLTSGYVNSDGTPRNIPIPAEDLKITFQVGSNLVAVPIIKGSVFNSSSQTTYKNVIVAVSYFTDSDQLIGREAIMATYTLQPGQIAEIRYKPQVKAYRRAARFRMELQEATPQ